MTGDLLTKRYKDVNDESTHHGEPVAEEAPLSPFYFVFVLGK